MENKVAFFSGAASGGSYGLKLLFVDWSQLAVEMSFKIFIAIVIAVVSGVFGLLSKDVYDSYIKPYLIKKKILK